MTTNNLFDASQQWATRPSDQRFTTLEGLYEATNSRRFRSRASDVSMGKVMAKVEGGKLVINSAISASTPSHWAFGQLCGEIGAPANYLRGMTDRPELMEQCLNRGLASHERGTAKFMTFANDDEGPQTLQAVTSPTYGRIWDADVVSNVMKLRERSGGKFYAPLAYAIGPDGRIMTGPDGQLLQTPSGLYASDRDCFVFMIDGGSRLEIGERAKLNRGFIVKNSEVGAAQLDITTFLFNEVCGNHIIWGAQNVRRLSIRHNRLAPDRFESQAFPVLMEYCQSSAAGEESTIRAAMGKALPKEDDERIALAARFKITRGELKEAKAHAEREEGSFATYWDLVQGLTAYARGFAYLDARTDLETRAGKILCAVEVTVG